MKTVLLILGGQIVAHDYPVTTQILADVLQKAGYAVRTISTSPAAIDLAGVNAAVIFTDNEFFTPDAITRLADFVRRGHGLVTMHTAAGTNKDSAELSQLVGTRQEGGVVEPHTAHIVDPHHPITQGLSDFEIDDEMHGLHPVADIHTLIDTEMNGVRQPLAYTHTFGEGKVVHLTHGHSRAGIANANWQEVFRRAVAFVTA